MQLARAPALAAPRLVRPRAHGARAAVPHAGPRSARQSESPRSLAGPRLRSRSRRAAAEDDKQSEPEPERDEDGLYIGTYSNFWSDPKQIRGVIIFCTVLASFFSLGNIGAAIVLPLLYNKPIELCFQAIVFGYPCAGQ